jgi:hypothetical protein
MENIKGKTVALTGKTPEDDFSGLVEALCSLKNGSTAGLKKRWQEQELPSRLFRTESGKPPVPRRLDAGPYPARSSGTDQKGALLLL